MFSKEKISYNNLQVSTKLTTATKKTTKVRKIAQVLKKLPDEMLSFFSPKFLAAYSLVTFSNDNDLLCMLLFVLMYKLL